MNVEEFIEATRRKLDEIERTIGCPTERDLVRALVRTHERGEPVEVPLRALLERMKAWDAPMPGAGARLVGEGSMP